MQTTTTGPLAELSQRFVDYLPTLAAGFVVLLVGIGLGWVAKRATVRSLLWLRLDRLSARAGWRAALGKGDVRAQLYELIGTVVMVLVLVVALNEALQIWGLSTLARTLDQIVLYLPRIGLGVLILVVGMLLTNTVTRRIENTLDEESVPHPRLLSRIVKAVLGAVVIALSLWELNLARDVVFAAFLIGFGAIGVAFALAFGFGTARAIQSSLEAILKKPDDEQPPRSDG